VSDCFEWVMSRNAQGYGQKRIDGVLTRMNRLAAEMVHGPIPEGMVVMHTCDNPPCVNPDHLVIASHRDNVLDKYRKGRGHKQKLTASDADEIRESRGKITQKALAERFGVTRSTINDIQNGYTWRKT
jgi:hypothetical protein